MTKAIGKSIAKLAKAPRTHGDLWRLIDDAQQVARRIEQSSEAIFCVAETMGEGDGAAQALHFIHDAIAEKGAALGKLLDAAQREVFAMRAVEKTGGAA
jgi:hypothetical protein